jgi:hypothetical protein
MSTPCEDCLELARIIREGLLRMARTANTGTMNDSLWTFGGNVDAFLTRKATRDEGSDAD